MGGKVLDYEAKTIRNEGVEEGIEEGIRGTVSVLKELSQKSCKTNRGLHLSLTIAS